MDFASGLHKRELASYLVSEALGWQIVPTTMVRDDGPFGVGSLQLFIAHDPTEHYFTIMRQHPDTHDQLRRIALFDLVVNNADRKAGHVLADGEGKLWAIDHGLCFAAPLKLRTVIWDFAGEAIIPELLEDIASLADNIPDDIAAQLTLAEASAMQDRAQELLSTARYPHDPTGMRFPWPLI